jgi:predicted nucleic acid-binding protein
MNDDPEKPFLDTNVLIYAACQRSSKTERASQILKAGGTISVQVLNEFASAASRKFSYTWPEIRESVENFGIFLEIVPLTQKTQQTAINFAERYNLAFYDAVIAAAAHLAGCTILYTEDMHHTLLIENRLRVTNPFTG